MYFDPLYWLMIGAGMALSLWAQFRVKSAFARFSRVGTSSGLTGAQVAQRILADNRISGVRIEPIAGVMTDHYDPRSRTLRLSRHPRPGIAPGGGRPLSGPSPGPRPDPSRRDRETLAGIALAGAAYAVSDPRVRRARR